MTLTRCLAIAICALLPPAAFAEAPLNVVATTTNIGMLVHTVGDDAVSVTVLAPPGRDAHHLQVRPSMMAALRQADLVVAVGAELEAGWLPPAIRGAANARIRSGQPGHLELAGHLDLIDDGRPADRAFGDVHPGGNPHFYLDPLRMAEAAGVLAERLATLRPSQAHSFHKNAADFAAAIEQKMPDWQARVADAPGVVLFHDDGRYMTERFGLSVLGTIEPLPGIPPTASHLNALVRELSGRDGVVIHAGWHPAQGPRFLARALDWPVRVVEHDVPLDRMNSEGWFAMIDTWIDAIGGKHRE